MLVFRTNFGSGKKLIAEAGAPYDESHGDKKVLEARNLLISEEEYNAINGTKLSGSASMKDKLDKALRELEALMVENEKLKQSSSATTDAEMAEKIEALMVENEKLKQSSSATTDAEMAEKIEALMVENETLISKVETLEIIVEDAMAGSKGSIPESWTEYLGSKGEK